MTKKLLLGVVLAAFAGAARADDPVTNTKFKKADGQWKLIVTDYAHAAPAEIPKQVELLKSMSEVMTKATDEINANKEKDLMQV